MDCLFCKFVNKEIDLKTIYEDDYTLAFKDIHPQAPHHILIIPKKHIASINDLQEEDSFIMGHLFMSAKKVAEILKINSYRIMINNGKGAGQSIFHLHLHLLGGRSFSEDLG